MKRRREGGWMREIGQINRRTIGSKEEGRHWGEGELTMGSARFFFFLEWRARREVFFFCWLLVFTSAAISD
jgi:hypothetical protein